MKTWIEINRRGDGPIIRSALDDPQVRAFVLVMGALRQLPSDRSRSRVLRFVADKLNEEFSNLEATGGQ